jgi:aminopeptidase N
MNGIEVIWRRLMQAVVVLSVFAAFAVNAEGPFAFESTPGKLPKAIVPRHYEIRIRPDLDKFVTQGSVTIDLEILKPANEIVLNALELEITKATLLTDHEIPLTSIVDATNQTVAFHLASSLAPGKCRLTVDFTGRIGEQGQGLFYVRYSSPAGRRVMLATQMEPTDARRMFPCWDEPAFRATFDLSVIVPEKHIAVSNMPIERETPLDGGFKEVKFVRTPAMASYLVALVSGELEELKGEAEGVQIRIITTNGKREQGRYALDATKKLLAYYNDYFGIKYPLPKLDQIAIPGDFDGAMENWGAITYNEGVLLFDPGTSSQETKQNIFVTVAHEMSHQWFGDLVTMGWWDNLWLNEGFATWMETKATDHFNPDWQMWLTAAAEKTSVMSGDARSTTHPIQTPIRSETQANDAFDTITYQKGGAFLRMLESYLGEKEFRNGIHTYLSAHAYGNTTTADLWAALESVSGKPIRAISAGWTEQPGVPVVKVKTDCVDGRRVVSLGQERFTVQNPSAAPMRWEIPITLVDTARPDRVKVALLDGESGSETIDDCQGAVKANAGDTGYYRVAYDAAAFQRLQADFEHLSAADRLNLLNDTWAMVEAGRASATNYFELLDAVRGEKTAAIWEQILATLAVVDELEQREAGRPRFHEYARELLRPQLDRLGWAGSKARGPESLLRGRVIITLSDFGDQQVIARTRELFQKFLSRPESVDADLRPAVFKSVGRYSDRRTYEQIHELAKKARGSEERSLYYQAMSRALDSELAGATLALSLTEETVPQEATHFVIDVADSSERPELAWQFAQQHMNELLPRVDPFERSHYAPSIMGAFCDAARADELEAYMKTNAAEDAQAKARETAEDIRLKASLKQRELPAIDQWVAARLAGKRKS